MPDTRVLLSLGDMIKHLLNVIMGMINYCSDYRCVDHLFLLNSVIDDMWDDFKQIEYHKSNVDVVLCCVKEVFWTRNVLCSDFIIKLMTVSLLNTLRYHGLCY